jgi:hypothetical protein
MRLKGTKNLSLAEDSVLKRDNPITVNTYKRKTLSESQVELIESFDKHSFDIYYNYYKKWGLQRNSRENLVTNLKKSGITGPALELALLRLQDNYTAQKVWACIKYRWTDREQLKIQKFNNSPDKFWFKMAGQIQRRCETDGKELDADWHGKEGRLRLVEYLKKLFEIQQGLCTISKQKMLLEISSDRVGKNIRLSNKCSPDRIDSAKGYVKGNIQLTTWWVNCWKADLTLDEFYNKIEIIRNNKCQTI